MEGVTSVSAQDTGFTLDAGLLAERRATGSRRLHLVQMPAMRLLGFLILCLIALLHDWRAAAPLTSPSLLLVLGLNLAYAALSWPLLRWGYERFARVDVSLVLLHVDVLVWLVNNQDIYGMSERLEWTPRVDAKLLVKEMSVS